MRRRRQSESGAVAVLAAFVLMTIRAFLALTLNVGHMMNARAQLQAAADAAALAGGRSLNGTAAGQARANISARRYAILHNLDTDAVAVDVNADNDAGGDVVSGYWDTVTRTFYGNGEQI